MNLAESVAFISIVSYPVISGSIASSKTDSVWLIGAFALLGFILGLTSGFSIVKLSDKFNDQNKARSGSIISTVSLALPLVAAVVIGVISIYTIEYILSAI